MSELIKKYQRTQSLVKRRSLLSTIVNQLGRDKTATICKLEDVDWLHWYYWEIPSKEGWKSKENKENKEIMQQQRDNNATTTRQMKLSGEEKAK
jgi:hypothetical protein